MPLHSLFSLLYNNEASLCRNFVATQQLVPLYDEQSAQALLGVLDVDGQTE